MWNNKVFGKTTLVVACTGLAISALFLCVAMGYLFGVVRNISALSSIQPVTHVINTALNNPEINNTEITPAPVVSLPADLLANLEWHYPEKLSGLNFFAPSFSLNEWFGGEPTSYDIGKFSYQDKAGKIIYVSLGAYPGSSEMNFKFVNYDGNYVVLKQESYTTNDFSDTDFFTELNGIVVKIDEELKFPTSVAINPPESLATGEKGQIVKFVQTVSLTQFDPNKISAEGTVDYQDPNYGAFYDFFEYNGDFSLILPDGEIAHYRLQNDMLNNITVSSILWNDKRTGDGEYSALASSCGGTYLNIVKKSLFGNANVDLKTDLIIIGKNKAGENIYEFKDTNHPYLKNIYDFTYYPNDAGEKISYAEFLSMHPLFIWVDPFGRMIDFRLNKLQPVAECGKPVIYLYPKKTMDVSVNVKPPGGLTYSEPELKDGWEVEATPYSNLTEIKTGRYYPYLFWEGRGDIYEQPKLGWVVKRSNVKQFLITKLAQLGLKRSETNDFLDF